MRDEVQIEAKEEPGSSKWTVVSDNPVVVGKGNSLSEALIDLAKNLKEMGL